jgi:16S rRNA (cytidine1402-2'-O)-methyltransferase
MLYLVPTPIGNLKDITLRAIDVLSEVDMILAEDTRQTGKLLKHLQIETSLRSFHSHNEHKKADDIIQQLSLGVTMALVSDAGSPGISDPGYLLVKKSREAGIAVIPLPGPTAFVPALTASGLPCEAFYFAGFLPHKKGRQTKWKMLKELDTTVILYESPFRLLKCLNEIKTYIGPETKVCVARELTKVFEEIETKLVDDMIEHYTSKPSIKGEIVVIFREMV